MPVIAFPLACSRCDAGLTGVDVADLCPRCFQPVGDTINLLLIDTAEMRVSGNSLCSRCGYNLRTLPIASVCTECGTPVSASLRPDELRYANPAWLGRVRTGVTLLAVAALSLIGGALLIALLAGFVFPFVAGEFFMIVFFLVVALQWVIGVLMATEADPRPRGRPMSLTPRQAARLFAIIAPALVAMLLMIAKAASSFGLDNSEEMVLLAGLTVAGLSALAAIVCTAICLRRLARRDRRTATRKLASVLIWLAAADCLLVSVTIGVMAYLSSRFRIAMAAASAATAPASAPATVATPLSGSSVERWLDLCAVVLVSTTYAGILGLYVLGLLVLFLSRRMLTAAMKD